MPIVLTPGIATVESLLIDPEYDDPANTELELHDPSDGITLITQEFPVPDPSPLAASSFDTEGEPVSAVHYPNREITFKVRVARTTHAGVESKIGELQKKVAKINREGGTLGRVTMGGGTIVFDAQTANIQVPLDWQYALARNVECELKFTALPFARGTEVTFSDHTETTLPVLIFVDQNVGGDVRALDRLVIDEDSGNSQWVAFFGLRSRYYDSAATAALYYEAEGRTAQGGSATNTGPTGASGTSVMRSAALSPSWLSILSTGALSHVGDYRAFARVQAPTANTGALSIRLSWGAGDYRVFTPNDPVVFPANAWDATWVFIDLGQIHIEPVASGAQQWEGRIEARSTVTGDKVDVDYLWLCPVTEGAAEISAIQQLDNPTTFNGRDEFEQAGSSSITTKTAAIGGTWTTSGGAGQDFQNDTTNKWAFLTDTAANNARFAILGSSTYAAQYAQVDVGASAITALSSAVTSSSKNRQGVILRWTDSSNYLRGTIVPQNSGATVYLEITKVVAGTETILGYVDLKTFATSTGPRYTLRLLADAAGRAFVWFGAVGFALGGWVFAVYDSVLATGGTLASGKVGMYDIKNVGDSQTVTRYYDNFLAATPGAADAAAFASQSLEIRSDRAQREDSGGTLWVEPSSYQGGFIRLPPAGREAREVETTVKMCRGPQLAPGVWADPALDDLSARHHVTPRYLVVP